MVGAFGLFIHRKQNSRTAWTGGPISWPKSLWLAYTVSTWFFFPILLFPLTASPSILFWAVVFHLGSWWARGPLELVMIYRWMNWTPIYGISHDLFHLLGLAVFMGLQISSGMDQLAGSEFIVAAFLGITCFAVTMEALFAYLFLKTRSKEEAEGDVYFASDDPKWRFINRVTKFTVTVVISHLLLQSLFTARLLWGGAE